ncbi:MAG: CpsD/CapB family tyrosine-protein kinase, partial [Slackia isoflavoniconvertens]|nr:CpsD/CapB family tyrosine-protein kinase [Slackia isoflavoniconvertens]
MARKKSQNQQAVQNSIKTLLANIRFASVDNPMRTLVVTSTVPNEGKSTITAQLAQAIAAGGKSVLVVECDMRKRSLAGILNVHPEVGLHAVLADEEPLNQAIVALPQQGLYFLDAEPHIPNPPDLLSSKRFGRFIGMVSREFDYVLFDTPPVGTFIDAAILSSLVDGTVLVVRDNFTKRD